MEGSSRRRVLAVLTSLSLFVAGTLIAGAAGEHAHLLQQTHAGKWHGAALTR